MDAEEDGDAVVAVRHVGGHAFLQEETETSQNVGPARQNTVWTISKTLAWSHGLKSGFKTRFLPFQHLFF